jgi:hypothetical protein
MKLITLLCAGASLLLLAGNASARQTVKLHKHRSHKAQTIRAVQPKDPNAAYWNDPGRAAPPFSYRGQP